MQAREEPLRPARFPSASGFIGILDVWPARCDNHTMTELALLKLGGSLITDKTRPYTARIEKIADLAREIAAAKRTRPDLPLLLGHGSGSFGHTAAKEYAT